MIKKSIYWFRKDLRLQDNHLLKLATEESKSLLLLYILPQDLDENFGYFKWKFWKESLTDLQLSAQNIGAELLILEGNPEELIPSLSAKYGVEKVYCTEESGFYEKQELENTRNSLSKNGITLHSDIDHLLIHPQDLSFEIDELPDIFTSYRKKAEKRMKVRDSISIQSLNTFKVDEEGLKLEELNCSTHALKEDKRAAFAMKGGRQAGLERLNYYLWQSDLISSYKETRNGLIGPDYSSKFSPYLAWGCLSAREIYHAIKKYEAERIANESTYWLIFELLWRDYFQLVMMKYPIQLFQLHGLGLQSPKKWRNTTAVFNAWVDGNTKEPMINANMNELAATGFMSNRGRQLVASYLVNDLGIDWRMGAAYFEKMLIDYDVASNWGNWAYVAGVGNDPRPNRYFNIPSQAERYDPDGKYQALWTS